MCRTTATGTASAAAGGVVTVLAMPNTQPPTDSPSILGSLLDRAAREAVVPTGFIPAITVGQMGDQLTEHGDLAEAGAAASDSVRNAMREPGVAEKPWPGALASTAMVSSNAASVAIAEATPRVAFPCSAPRWHAPSCLIPS